MKKHEAEARYGVPAYAKWSLVPPNLFTRNALKERGIIVPKDAKPDGCKTDGSKNKPCFFLFNITKYRNETATHPIQTNQGL